MVRASTTSSTRGSSDAPVLGGPTPARLEAEVTGFGLDLLQAPAGAVGVVVADRWEAALLAVLAAREARPDLDRPTLAVADTGHPAYLRAARLLGVEVVTVAADRAGRATVGPMAHALDERTVLAVVSAPNEDGSLDPVTWIGTAAAAKGVPLHVDAAGGAWLLAFAERLGRVVPPWTFAAPATTSVALDLHEAGTGGPVLLALGDPADRCRCGEPRGEPSDVLLRAAWTHVHGDGADRHLVSAAATLRTVDALVSTVTSLPGLELAVPPESRTLVLHTDARCDPFTVVEELRSRGWYAAVRPSRPGAPAGVRLTVDARAREHPDDCVADLREATALACARGPVALPSRVLDHLRRLDPARVRAGDVALLLEGLGLDPGTAADSARFAALLDAAPVGLRRALAARHRELLHTSPRATEPAVSAWA